MSVGHIPLMWSGITVVTTFIITWLSVGSQCVYLLHMNASLRSFVSWPGKVPDALGTSGLAGVGPGAS
jgi:hypothetical protein